MILVFFQFFCLKQGLLRKHLGVEIVGVVVVVVVVVAVAVVVIMTKKRR